MNIFKEVRLRHSMTQRQIAELAHVSPQAVMRYEQGLYEQPSIKLVAVIAELSGLPPETVVMKYDMFRDDHQKAAYRFMIPNPPLRIEEGKHPFTTYREAITDRAVGRSSRISFCILLALHPAVVAEYDSGHCEKMPALISRALINTGIDTEFIENLAALGEVWYDRFGNR